MPLNPLRNDYAHPPEGAIRAPEAMGLIRQPWGGAVALLLPEYSELHQCYRSLRRVQSPPRRVNGVVVEEVERQDVARATEGHGWPIVECLWSGDGVNEPSRSEGRMNGRRVLVTFVGPAIRGKSHSPGRAKPKTSAEARQSGTDTQTTSKKTCRSSISQRLPHKTRMAL